MASVKDTFQKHKTGISLGLGGLALVGVGVFLHARRVAAGGSAASAVGFIGTPYTQPSLGPLGTGSTVGLTGAFGGSATGTSPGGGGGGTPPNTGTSTTSPTAPAGTTSPAAAPQPVPQPPAGSSLPLGASGTGVPAHTIQPSTGSLTTPGGDQTLGGFPQDAPVPQGSAGGFAGIIHASQQPGPTILLPSTAPPPSWARASSTHTINNITYYGVSNAADRAQAQREGFKFATGRSISPTLTANATYAYR